MVIDFFTTYQYAYYPVSEVFIFFIASISATFDNLHVHIHYVHIHFVLYSVASDVCSSFQVSLLEPVNDDLDVLNSLCGGNSIDDLDISVLIQPQR